jgi:hypothetical protein
MRRARTAQRRLLWLLSCSIVSALSAPCFAAKPGSSKAAGKSVAPASAAPPPSAPAGPKSLSDTLTDDAKADYESGKLLYGDGDYAGARVKFFAAYELSHDPRLLWNVAVCEKGQRHYAKVVVLVKKYLDSAGDVLSADDRKDAQDLLSAIESFTVDLSISVNEPDAQISIDGESVGSSPLPGPLTVDIGTRQIELQKPGFVPFSQSLPVGGNKQAVLNVKLEREVHEGELSVTAPPTAAIFLDSKQVGVGHFASKLASGGHTLRVQAPGFRPYQSEVVVQDREKRGVDVTLEAIAPSAPLAAEQAPEGPLHGLELGLHLGYGSQTNKVSVSGNGSTPDTEETAKVAFIPVGLDIGYRLGRPTYLGIFGEYGTLDRSGTCGVARHGPHEDFPGDPAVRYGYTSCSMVKLGVMLVFHILPRTIVDPYFGFEAAAHGSFDNYRSFDPTTGQTTQNKDGNGSFQPGFRLGLDSHPIPTLGAGIYSVLGPSFGGEGEPRNSNDCQSNTGTGNGSNGCTNTSSNPGWFIVFGARVAYTFQ